MRFLSRALMVLLLYSSSLYGQQVQSVLRIGMTVDDMDRSLEFYTRVLGFQKQRDFEIVGAEYEKLYNVFGLRARVVVLKLGDETIELTEYLTPRGRLIPRDSRSNDRWFQHIAIVTTNMDRAYQYLRDHKVRYESTGPQRIPDSNPNAGGIEAFYFRDPDDHVLEIIQFPKGKGDPRWQAKPGLFAGIDHTAIVVQDTENSLRFYCTRLGMREVDRSENFGAEQEHLNNVQGAHLRITGLRAVSGPGIELLEYVAPGGGRPYPSDARSNDICHWQTIITTTESLPGLQWIDVNDSMLGLRRTSLVTDPDMHVVQLILQPAQAAPR